MSVYGQLPGYTCHYCRPTSHHPSPWLYYLHLQNYHPQSNAVPACVNPTDPNDFTSFCPSLAHYFPRHLPVEMGLFPTARQVPPPQPLLDAQGQVVLGPGPKFAPLRNFPNMPDQICSMEDGWRLVMFEVMNPGCTKQDFVDRMFKSGAVRSDREEAQLKNSINMKMRRYRMGEYGCVEGRLKNFFMLPTNERRPTSHPKLIVLDSLTAAQLQLRVVWPLVWPYGPNNPPYIVMPQPTGLAQGEIWNPVLHQIPAANFTMPHDARLVDSIRVLRHARILANQSGVPVAQLTSNQVAQLVTQHGGAPAAVPNVHQVPAAPVAALVPAAPLVPTAPVPIPNVVPPVATAAVSGTIPTVPALTGGGAQAALASASTIPAPANQVPSSFVQTPHNATSTTTTQTPVTQAETSQSSTDSAASTELPAVPMEASSSLSPAPDSIGSSEELQPQQAKDSAPVGQAAATVEKADSGVHDDDDGGAEEVRKAVEDRSESEMPGARSTVQNQNEAKKGITAELPQLSRLRTSSRPQSTPSSSTSDSALSRGASSGTESTPTAPSESVPSRSIPAEGTKRRISDGEDANKDDRKRPRRDLGEGSTGD